MTLTRIMIAVVFSTMFAGLGACATSLPQWTGEPGSSLDYFVGAWQGDDPSQGDDEDLWHYSLHITSDHQFRQQIEGNDIQCMMNGTLKMTDGQLHLSFEENECNADYASVDEAQTVIQATSNTFSLDRGTYRIHYQRTAR